MPRTQENKMPQFREKYLPVTVELLKLFGAMDEKTRQIMLVQMRAVAKI